MAKKRNTNGIPVLASSGLTDAGDRPSPKELQERTQTSFTAKVALLEEWSISGVPAGQWWPKTAADLRRWHQPELGVRAWSSPNVATENGPYADLRRRFDACVAKLVTKDTPATVREIDRALRIQAEARVLALSTQNAGLMSEMRAMQSEFEIVKGARDAAQRRIRELEETIRKVSPVSFGGKARS